MIELVRPTVDLRDGWWELVDDFGGATIHGSGYHARDREVLGEARVFAEWVDWLGRQQEHPDEPLPPERVPSSYRWVLDDGHLVGTIAVRHALTPSLVAEGGHIGYAVRPAARRRGVATAALTQALRIAARRGIDPVLVTCDRSNMASARTITACGGVLEDSRDGVLRHWLRTGAPAAPIGSGPIETHLATLVPVTWDEARAMVAGSRHRGWAPGYPREDDLDAVRTMTSDGPDPWTPRHVVRRSDGLAVGTIGCFGPPVDGVVEVGYGLVEPARGTGLMTDVLSGMVRAIEAAGLRVVAHTLPDNVPSHRVLARLGFVREDETGPEWLWVRRSGAGVVGTA
ncbi:GNAT family N-acetyltransferase [Terrabacter terrigena]|uniref:GNAT family N-acetyltransferase n=1 Tax=Terrabacter terrigena TaxID=574718 RepID=A0ABW3MW30_9MICO